MIPSPFLLYLGHSNDEIGIKTSRGIAAFRPQDCVGEFRYDDCGLTVGLSRLSMEEAKGRGARTLVLGIANAGGGLSEELIADALSAVGVGLNVAAGLHQRLRDVPRLASAAKEARVALFDVRDPPAQIKVGNGLPRPGMRLLTVGTDCSVGKMYTSLVLTKALQSAGFLADFRATGQTGLLIAGDGVPVDAVVADFISGAIEQVSPARYDGGWDVIEGQGSLFHPSFAGVSTGLLHGAQPDAIVLCHEPGRPHMRGLPHYALPDAAECLEENLRVARLTSPKVRAVGVALNTSKMSGSAGADLCAQMQERLQLPCTDPFRFGADAIVKRIVQSFSASQPKTKV